MAESILAAERLEEIRARFERARRLYFGSEPSLSEREHLLRAVVLDMATVLQFVDYLQREVAILDPRLAPAAGVSGDDAANQWLVTATATGDRLIMRRPPHEPFTPREALGGAAWLIALGDRSPGKTKAMDLVRDLVHRIAEVPS